MTREHKLALIVGFSLILLVGVLISDHLSSARQARVGDGPGEYRIAEAPMILPTEPLRGLEPQIAWDHGPQAYQAVSPDVVPELPSTVVERNPRHAEVQPAPVIIQQGSLSSRSSEVSPELARAIDQRGGEIRTNNGIAEIVLPQAAEIRQTATSPAQPAATAQATGNFEWHTVGRGESLYRIAAQYYGDGNMWRELARVNSDRVDANGSVRAGVKIRIPMREAAAPSSQPPASQPAPQRQQSPRQAPPSRPQQPNIEYATYTVKRGETLGVISQRTLGTIRRMNEIMELNNIEDADNVPAGMVLKIPVANRS